MSVVSAIASICVGISLVIAGASKLAASESWPIQARGLKAPAWTIPIVPWFEMALGALLIVQLVRRPAAIVAATLFAVFTVMIAARLRAGERPACACFGAWSATPIGARHVMRNAALIVLAIVAAAASS